MPDFLPDTFTILELVGVWIGVVFFFFGLFAILADFSTHEKYHEWVNEQAKRLATATSKPVKDKWQLLFLRMFERLFGERHWSWQCFLRSGLASFLSLGVMAIIFVIMNPTALKFSTVNFFLYLIGGGVLLNFLPDFLSLGQTRWVLKKISHSKIWVGLWLIFDFVLTTLIFIVGVLAFVFFIKFLERSGFSLLKLNEILTTFGEDIPILGQVLFLSEDSIFGLFYWTTYITSFWLYLFMLVRWSAYLFNKIGFIKFICDPEKKPFHYLGWIAVCIVTLIYCGFIVVAIII